MDSIHTGRAATPGVGHGFEPETFWLKIPLILYYSRA